MDTKDDRQIFIKHFKSHLPSHQLQFQQLQQFHAAAIHNHPTSSSTTHSSSSTSSMPPPSTATPSTPPTPITLATTQPVTTTSTTTATPQQHPPSSSSSSSSTEAPPTSLMASSIPSTRLTTDRYAGLPDFPKRHLQPPSSSSKGSTRRRSHQHMTDDSQMVPSLWSLRDYIDEADELPRPHCRLYYQLLSFRVLFQ
jgi:hypothetical protein